ncbi:NAD(P)-binding protein [Coemansia reversa NRRL 1564]|uniref:NAD(P)-binding protein n=1 Tax=Coemansia reversa (strain ATCC 12441 / NRRL 1564) TaxID=763665 RepID=A0A2G5B1A2_COERN|nr:NAD(P)-binding protein [Coemansia reversa NRRL 1564]|eukprot:PIA12798.1 NAD(P)-binding protein [Coemansia reversa NRRL 1564]
MGFSPISNSKAEWVPRQRQDGRRYIVTGSNRGIGYETATGLAALGAQVVMVGHEGSDAFNEAMDRIAMETGCPRDQLSYMPLDLRSLDSVRAFVREWSQRPTPEQSLNGLINNAGIAGAPGLSPDGFELCFQINYLSMVLLTRLLLPYLQASKDSDTGAVVPARIVCVSSMAHLFTLGIPTEESYLRSSGGGFFSLRYGESKLCVISFVRQLAARLKEGGRGDEIEIVSVHPGSTASSFWQGLPGWTQGIIARVAQDPSRGARTSLFCATESKLLSGAYYAECSPALESFWLGNNDKANLLWRKSCAWAGVSPTKLFK